jgi:hypothetical protein
MVERATSLHDNLRWASRVIGGEDKRILAGRWIRHFNRRIIDNIDINPFPTTTVEKACLSGVSCNGYFVFLRTTGL